MSISDVTKKRGRPATGRGTPITLRLQSEQLLALDQWIAAEDDNLTRPEAVRRLMVKGFGKQR